MKQNLEKEKIDLIQWVTTLEDPNMIQKLIDLRQNESKDWWYEITEAERKSINKGIAEADDKVLKPHSEAKNIYEKWL